MYYNLQACIIANKSNASDDRFGQLDLMSDPNI